MNSSYSATENRVIRANNLNSELKIGESEKNAYEIFQACQT